MEDLERKLKELENGSVSNEHYVKGHFFHGVEMFLGRWRSISLMKLAEKNSEITTTVAH